MVKCLLIIYIFNLAFLRMTLNSQQCYHQAVGSHRAGAGTVLKVKASSRAVRVRDSGSGDQRRDGGLGCALRGSQVWLSEPTSQNYRFCMCFAMHQSQSLPFSSACRFSRTGLSGGGAGAGRCDGSALPSVAADHREQGLAFWSGRWRSVQKHSPLLGASDKGLPR